MNDYVTVDRVKMTKLYPEGGAEAPPVADAAKFAGGPAVRPHASGHQNMLPASFSRFARALLILCPLKQKRRIHESVSFFFGAGDEARTRYLDLGKVALYQMSYARTAMVIIRHETTIVNSFFHSFRIISTIPQVSVSG